MKVEWLSPREVNSAHEYANKLSKIYTSTIYGILEKTLPYDWRNCTGFPWRIYGGRYSGGLRLE
ncbi:hypothetical protein J7L27_00340 [Candidatus Bathyarchaeota archaeon]|nr:hypothetical protein [Candidatus Bathyarchaeota archaeon]